MPIEGAFVFTYEQFMINKPNVEVLTLTSRIIYGTSKCIFRVHWPHKEIAFTSILWNKYLISYRLDGFVESSTAQGEATWQLDGVYILEDHQNT